MNENKPRLSAAIARAVGSVFGLLVIGALLSVITKAHSAVGGTNGLLSSFPNYATYITIAIGHFFIYNSFVLAFSAFDKEERERFLDTAGKQVYFGEEIGKIIRSASFITEALATAVLLSLTALLGAFSCFGRIFYEDGRWDGGWFPIVVLVPVCLVLLLLSKYEARRYWVSLKLIGEVEAKLDRPWRLFFRLALICILYPTVFPFSPLLVFIIWNFISVIIKVTDTITVFGTIAAIIALFIIVYVISLLSVTRKRKKFLRSLRAVCAENGYTVSEPKAPYSAFIKTRPTSFLLEAEGKKYECILIPTLHKRTPFIVNSATGGYFRHRIGSKNHHFTINHTIDFFGSGEGERIVILSPTPKYVLIVEGKIEKRLVSGDKLWDFIIYSEESFISAIDRHCLGRTNRDN